MASLKAKICFVRVEIAALVWRRRKQFVNAARSFKTGRRETELAA